MAIIHIVMFGFMPELDRTEVEEICKRMVDLKDQCLHPKTSRPYIKSGVGGEDNSPEGHQRGITHVFVVEFDCDEDRKYYLEEDPAHQAFTKSLDGKVAIVQVVDFTPGIY